MPLYSMGKSTYNPFQVFGNKKTHFNVQIQSMIVYSLKIAWPQTPLTGWGFGLVDIQFSNPGKKPVGTIYFAAKGHSDEGVCA